MRRVVAFHVLASTMAIACSGTDPVQPEAGAPDATTETGVDAGADVTLPPGTVGPKILTLSDGNDRLLGLTHDAKGDILAVGWSTPTNATTDDRSTIVVKIGKDGELDPSFGTKGIAKINVVAGTAGEEFRAIGLQSDGKIVIYGMVEHLGGPSNDRDVAIVRLDTTGAVDTTFGTSGIKVLNLSDPTIPDGGTNGVGIDSAGYNLLIQKDDKIIVPAGLRAAGRDDTDFALVRVDGNGSLDSTFGTGGVVSIDVELGSVSVRTATLLPDGSIVEAGYTTPPSSTVRPVIWKVTAGGVLDSAFGTAGIFTETTMAMRAEAYGAVLQGANLVTVGYGHDTSETTNDWSSLRLTSNGQLDTTYGTNGLVRIDFFGESDNGRGLAVLPDERLMLIGGARVTASNSNAAIVVLQKNGAPDQTFGPGGKQLFELGGASDFFWAIDVAPDKKTVAIVGTEQVAADAGTDDDSVVMIIPTK